MNYIGMAAAAGDGDEKNRKSGSRISGLSFYTEIYSTG
jgi:hypothetical protein